MPARNWGKRPSMKTKTSLFCLICLFLCWCAMAQDTNAVPGATGGGLSAKLGQFQWVLIPLTTTVIGGLKKFISMIPSQLWPWVSPFLGAGLDWIGSKAGIWSGDPTVGALMGGAGTWFHQLLTQTKDLVATSKSKTP